MAVHCSNCGEELMGAVNRCWRCGRAFEPQKGEPDKPPIREAPRAQSDAPPVTAEVLNTRPSRARKAIRRGSPFAARPAQSGVATSREAASAPFMARPPRNAAARVGAALSLVLGLLSLTIAWVFPVGALVVAAAGISMGCWGLYSERRGLAIAGLMLSCLALALAGFNAVVELYTYLHGIPPWETVGPDTPF